MKPNILIWKNTATFDPNRLGTGSKNKSPSCGLPTLPAVQKPAFPAHARPGQRPPGSAQRLPRGQSHQNQSGFVIKALAGKIRPLSKGNQLGRAREAGTAGIALNAASICKPYRSRLPWEGIPLLLVALSIFTSQIPDSGQTYFRS